MVALYHPREAETIMQKPLRVFRFSDVSRSYLATPLLAPLMPPVPDPPPPEVAPPPLLRVLEEPAARLFVPPVVPLVAPLESVPPEAGWL